MKKTFLAVVVTASLTSLLTAWGVSQLTDNRVYITDNREGLVQYASNPIIPATQPVDFTPAAESAVKSVVHVKTITKGRTASVTDPFDPFGMFGQRQIQIPQQMGSGSGVIISQDGYIITNNHVVAGADQVQVTFNDRSTEIAEVVGTDPSTDLAVLKINGKDLPYMTIGNSDDVKLGQWVLAVGYPLNLDATVTAGIVSAKGRSIGINRKQSNAAIESFIQTDAAVNQGNSGGALVNTNGQLIGINSAIASQTGFYTGYSYAIPSNLAQKVAMDIIKYGDVQRGYLGAELLDLNKINEQEAQQIGISKEEFRNAEGVYINKVMPGSGAEAAGLKKGDYIVKINDKTVKTTPQLMEQIARYHPGDKLDVTYIRNGKTHSSKVELRKQKHIVGFKETEGGELQALGATFKGLSANDARKLRIEGGVVVADIQRGVLSSQTNIRKGFIITSINEVKIKSLQDFQKAIETVGDKSVEIGGIYPNRPGRYYYGLNSIVE